MARASSYPTLSQDSVFSLFSVARLFLARKNIWIFLFWAGINTAAWRWFSPPETTLQWIHWIRTGFPSIALAAGLHLLFSKQTVLIGPLKFFVIYGLIGLLSGVFSPQPFQAFYWALNYLSVFAGIALYFRQTDLNTAKTLNYLSWGITFLMLNSMVFLAREALEATNLMDVAVYNIHAQIGNLGGMPISRSSGMARFAAVPAIVGFVMLWGSRNMRSKVFGTCIFMPSALLVWSFQSRGAILGLAFAICFVTYFLGKRSRWIAFLGAIFCVFMLWTNAGSQQYINYIFNHVSRGQAMEELISMSGRDRVWRSSWPEIFENPFLGQGFQADRFVTGQHVHNTYLYALMSAGFIGAGFFCLGLAWAWYLFWKAWRMRWGQFEGQYIHLIQVGGVLAFFTVRSVPEVSGSLYGIDLFLMVPAIAYLTVLSKISEKKRLKNAR